MQQHPIGAWAFEGCDKLNCIIIDSDDKTEIARVTALLPESLRSKVITRSFYAEVIQFKEQQLARILSRPETHRLYGFFHYASRYVSTVEVKVNNEQGEEKTLEETCTKLPSNIFLHLNQLTKTDNPYYQHAQAAIKRLPFPKTPKEFEDYQSHLSKQVTQYIVQAMQQARHFSASKVVREAVSQCAPVV